MTEMNHDEINEIQEAEATEVIETPETVDEIATPEVVEEVAPVQIRGIVSGCKRLNIRNTLAKSAKVVTEVPVGTELMIDIDGSDDGWYSVKTSDGIAGFCMKQYITVQD